MKITSDTDWKFVDIILRKDPAPNQWNLVSGQIC